MSTIIDKNGNVRFFGKLSWGNFVDWLITFCLGGIIVMTTLHLGGVRPDTQVVLLPLYFLLLLLHGLWLLVNSKKLQQLSAAPFWFLPILAWMQISVLYVTPMPWLGWHELIYAWQAFMLFWVLCNNVETRAHLWVLLLMSASPLLFALFDGFYQFFQDPERIAGALTDFRLVLPAQFHGRATGAFADPFTFAAFLLIFLPTLLIAAAAPRLPKILRILCLYIVLMVMAAIVFTQVYWAGVLMVLLVGLVPWFCYRRLKQRILLSTLGVLATAGLLVLLASFHPLFERGFQRALDENEESVRVVLWSEALAIFAEHPVQGVGVGAYGITFDQSSRVALAKSPESPHNDYLLILSQLGLVGFVLFWGPILYLVFRAWRAMQQEPFVVKFRDKKGYIMPPRRFFLSVGLAGSLGIALCMSVTFFFYVPTLLFLGVLLLSILVKTSFPKKPLSARRWPTRLAYFSLVAVVGVSFGVFATAKLQSRSLELRATQELDRLVEMRLHLSGSGGLLDKVIVRYEEALIADPDNVDAWLGLSSALCQRYFQSPMDFDENGSRAISSARRATELSPPYWRAWAQLGVALAYNGEPAQAEAVLVKALEMAPNSGQAHYYYAALIGVNADRREEALKYVERALEIDPENSVARRLEQKLRIL